MTIWLYCICHNEARLMPYLLRHYTPWVDKLIFYDDASDDGTAQLIAAAPQTELRPWTGSSGMVDDEFLELANRQYREARGQADWVLWIDADEFIYHPQVREVLARYQQEGVTVPLVAGYAMIATALPKGEGQIYDYIKTGMPSPEWSKRVVFNPNIDMRWHVGRHSLFVDASNQSQIIPSAQADLKLLHYRYLGTDYVQARCAKNYAREPQRCRERSYGDNNFPGATKHYSPHWFAQVVTQPWEEVL